MNITKIYIYLMYLIVISCVISFMLKEHYIIASLLFLGNMMPGYAMAASMMGFTVLWSNGSWLWDRCQLW